MIDHNSQFFAILTAVGEAKQANADALGIPWTFSQMGVGDAGGTDPVPDRLQTQLIREWRRAPLNQLRPDPSNPNIIVAELVIPAEVGGRWIREVGLYDSADDLVAVANCPPSYKPLLAQGSGRTQTVRVNLIVSSTANVVLKIDPSVVLATRAYVDQRLSDELGKLDAKQSVRVATTGPVALFGLQAIEGVSLAGGDRVLVKNQRNGRENGLYAVVATGAWIRVTDADAGAEVTSGLLVGVEEGSTLYDTLWQLITDGPIVLGTTVLVFEQVAGPTGAMPGSYRQVQIDRRGLVVAGTNPTTLSGYGISDAYSKNEVDAKDGLLQPKLGFTPIQQGTGVGQVANPVKIGWSGAHLKLTVDATDFGNLWYSANFDPNSKANWGATLAAYGITNAYTKAESDARDAQRPVADSITHVGFASNNPDFPYMRSSSDGQVYFLQPRLGYTPIEQGGGGGQLTNKIRLGFNGGGSLRLQVDATDLGDLICDTNLGFKLAGAGISSLGSFAFARVISSQGSMNQGTLVAGTNLIYSSTNPGDGSVSNSGHINVGTWRLHGAVTGFERSLFQRVG